MRAVPALKTLPDDALAQLSARGLVVRKAAANRVEVSAGGRVSQMALIVHTGPGMPSPERIADAKAETDLPVLITAVSIGPKAGSRLEGAGLHYVDLAGNASVHLPGIAVSVEGRPRVPLPSRYAVTAAFRRAGLQAVGTILSRPEHPVPTLRVVAEQAGISIGSAQGAVLDLREQGYLDSDGRLQRGGELLHRWVAAFAASRTLTASARAFRAEPGWWEREQAFRADGAHLGGEAAAEALGIPLRSLSGSIYADALPTTVIRHGRLVTDAEGTVELREKFWRLPEDGWIAPTPIVYAELFADSDPRLREAADQLRRRDAVLRRVDAS